MVLSVDERIFLVEYVFREGDKYSDLVKRKFSEKFPDSIIPHRNAVRTLIEKFRATGSVEDAERSGRPRKLDEQKLLDISDSMAQSPKKSMRKLAQQHDIGVATAHKAVRQELNLFPYKVRCVQELKPSDNDKRLNYCHWFQRFINQNSEDILDVTFYTDEAWFHLGGYVNSQNTRLWSENNPRAIHEHSLHEAKIGVWVAVSRARIVGPIFFTNTVNSERYCSGILSNFTQQLTQVEMSNGWFQQDGATAHTSNISMAFLRNVFGERIISKNLWPARSPDLTPPDFFLWGAAKQTVYRNRPHTIDELKAAITAYISEITVLQLRKVFANKMKRVQCCIDVNGGHFEHIL